DSDALGGLDALAADPHMAGPTRRCCGRAGFVDAHGPQPAVDSGGCGLHKVQATAGRRGCWQSAGAPATVALGMTMKRRTFLIGSLSGLTLLAVSACTPEAPPVPKPTPTVPPTTSRLPRPSAFRRSDWAGDPFSRGAVSFQPVGSTPGQREILAEPVARRVFLAGEH